MLENFISTECSQIQRLALGGEGYNAVHFALAALELLESEFHTVMEGRMRAILGGKQGESAGGPVLSSLVRVNAISVRPFSNFPSKDIPAEVSFHILY